ncbi:MAG: sodium-translocating pyrophosphatase [Candidatus Omnitrophota bacterium]|nr:sodium-translocating pyrophosphatase [Candidatus Omnitrophota bacterium]MBU1523844.1 sodium-translocating pyrophosphatase [Candidatus Omnitrophota bacterium]MBU2436611.1 sodium-translocating pyrophosphatase [Candidatus Omnitrophota bacterium]MBU2504670.1 sodium-translocating pyrophosphatase [Candidatus Omnitrophota bacterium]
MGYLVFVLISALIALGFCVILTRWIFKQPQGTAKMKEISGYIKEGAKGYLKQQYRVVGVFFIIVFFILFLMGIRGFLSIFVSFAFISGGICSALCGWIGMYIATSSNSRTAHAAKKSLNSGLKIAFSAGTIMGLVVVGLALFYLSGWFWFLKWWYARGSCSGCSNIDSLTTITSTMLCFGMGASCYALFARVGGGIYTKAADVGADLVGKIEAGIPEDDPRNPAVIADQVGDNVGDVAGMGADLYESYVDSLVAAMALAVTAGLGLNGVLLPLVLGALGAIASVVGYFFVKTKKESQKDLIFALRKGVFSTAFLVSIFSLFFIFSLLGKGFIGVWLAVICGLGGGILLGLFTEYFTSTSFSPVQKLAKSSSFGPATVVIGGISLGMASTIWPILLVCLVIFLSFYFAGSGNYSLGLYGIGIASVGLLSTLGTTLASDAYGPVADNAGGIAEMSGLDKEVRVKTDQLDSLGNTTAATGKGFAIGSAALTTLVLIVAYKENVLLLGGRIELSLLNVRLLIGLLIGGMLPFAFCSLTLNAVAEAAGFIVEEVRRQFRQIKGLLEGTAKADYSTCVKITTQTAQKKMIAPALLALIAPIFVGLIFGAEAVAGLLVGSLISGFVLAVMMANAGGAWDNAKKFIEAGNLGGKGSLAHKAAVVGDTIGDPFKDTAGPSLNILLKLMAMVAITFTPLIINYSLFK